MLRACQRLLRSSRKGTELGQVKEGDSVELLIMLTWSGGVIMDTFKVQDQFVQVTVGDTSVLPGLTWLMMK